MSLCDCCKKISKLICIIITVVICLIILLFIILLIVSSRPIKDDYYNDIKTSYEIENKYRPLGQYEIDYLKYNIAKDQYKEIIIYFPKNIKNSNIKYPIIIMSNGTGVPYKKYSAIFKHLASWGFIVVGNDDEWSFNGESTIFSLNYILNLNNDKNSIFYNKIDKDNIGVSGHSQGGVAAIHSVYNFSESYLFKTIYAASSPGKSFIKKYNLTTFEYDISKVKIPILMLCATGIVDSENIISLDDLIFNYKNLSYGVPAVIGRRKNCDHGDMLTHGDAYMTAWFCYLLKNDRYAGNAFIGKNPEILRNKENWQDVEIKNMNNEIFK